MRRVYILLMVLVFLILPVTTLNAKDISQKISVWINGMELKPRSDAEAKMINNHVYVPASMFREAGFSVEYNNSTIKMVDKNLVYFRNLELLNAFHYTYINHFEKIDQEITNILGNILLEQEVNMTKLTELVDYVEIESNSFDITNYTQVGDYSPYSVFTNANRSINSYKKAINALEKYVVLRDKELLEKFYAEREVALLEYSLFTNEFDLVFKRSILNAIK
ncbi:hypothetical protein [Paenibacillus illinoisensis]|uniref:hypothetical protein n=1 Tax=Paenibacillus illinoisensis TaxID=59845 RepID=UPI00301CD9E5